MNTIQTHKTIFKNTGETLIEVMVSIVILSIIIVSTIATLSQAFSKNTNIKNRNEAIYLSQEGIEAVRNIRDTNWLKYSGDKRNSWRCKDSDDPLCDGNNNGTPNEAGGLTGDFIEDGWYTIEFNTGTKRFDLAIPTEQSEMNILGNEAGFVEYKLYHNDGRLDHDNSGILSPFYRQIEIEILNPFDEQDNIPFTTLPDFCDNDITHPDCTKARMKIVSRVQWMEQTRFNEVILETHLFDFLDRDAY